MNHATEKQASPCALAGCAARGAPVSLYKLDVGGDSLDCVLNGGAPPRVLLVYRLEALLQLLVVQR